MHVSSLSRSGQCWLRLVLALALSLPEFGALAATPSDPAKATRSGSEAVPVDGLLLAIQSLLAEMGLYHGALDGRMTPATADAIRLHQKAWNLRQTGQPSEDLLQHLEMVAGMRRIERRLKQSRVEQISGAQRQIEESPATRKLLLAVASRPLPTVDDPKKCFASPEPECLTILARKEALASPPGAMRDWALSEVSSEAAEAGAPMMAWEIASRIEDPRSLIAALGSVAKSLAEGGHFQASLEALEAIPDPVRRCEAALALSYRQAEFGQVANAKAAREVGLRMMDRLKQPEDAMSARLRLAEIALRLGEAKDADGWKGEAERRLNALPADARQGAMASLSSIETGLGRLDVSRQWLVQVHDGLLRVPSELKLIDAMAETGREAEAQNLVREIEQPRYRVLGLVRLAHYRINSGDGNGAERFLREAAALVGSIDLPFAKAYGESQISQAWQTLGRDETAWATARSIEDEAIKAQTMWRLSDASKSKRKTTEIDEAKAATQAYADPFGRVWMYAEMARERHRLGDGANANAHLSRGLALAEAIKDPWSRSRSLAALAGALAEMRRR